MSITLRSLAAGDISEIARIEQAASANPWNENQLRVELNKTESRSWVALDETTVAGFAIVWHIPGEAQLAELSVDPSRWRRGIGRALLRKVCEGASDAGLERMTLEVREGNRAAQGLYASEGFVLTAKRPNYYDNEEASLLMEKKLAVGGKRKDNE